MDEVSDMLSGLTLQLHVNVLFNLDRDPQACKLEKAWFQGTVWIAGVLPQLRDRRHIRRNTCISPEDGQIVELHLVLTSLNKTER